MPTYYSGKDLSAQVEVTPQDTFAQLVKEVLGQPIRLPVSRQAYEAMSAEARQLAKRVPYLVPCAFRSSPSRRVMTEATVANLIALDIDNSAEAGPFFRAPSNIGKHLPWSYALHTTASSTPDAPRLRLWVEASSVPVARYKDAVTEVARRLGVTANKESRVAVQPMFLPCQFAGEDGSNPLIGVALNRGALTLADITAQDQTIPLGTTPDDALANWVDTLPPVSGLTLTKAGQILDRLDPDASYGDWIEAAAALKHQFADEPEAALEMFDRWSRKGGKYPGPDEVKRKWDSFRAVPKGRQALTMRSLMRKAQETGWHDAELVKASYDAAEAWLTASARTREELMRLGPKVVAQVPLADAIQTSALTALLCKMLKEHGVQTSLPDIKRAVRAAGHTDAPEEQDDFPRWARGCCYVQTENLFVWRADGKSLVGEAVDNAFGRELIGQDSPDGRPSIRPRDYLLNVLKIPTPVATRYDPSRPTDTFAYEAGRQYLNTYVPDYPAENPDKAEEAGRVFYTHLTTLLPDARCRDILVSWLALHVQEPGRKIRWAVLLQGAPGCGKTYILEMMRRVLGPTNVRAVEAESLYARFNAWARNQQLVGFEEIRVVGENRHQIMDKLKTAVSNDYITVEEKFQPLVEVPNRTNYLAFTNAHGALAISEDDRRYFALASALQTKADVQKLPPDYFAKLFRVDAGGLRSWLKAWQPHQEFDPDGTAPVTDYRKTLVSDAETPVAAAISQALQDGGRLLGPDVVGLTSLSRYVTREGVNHTPKTLGVILRERGWRFIGRQTFGPEKESLYAHPDASDDAVKATLEKVRTEDEPF